MASITTSEVPPSPTKTNRKRPRETLCQSNTNGNTSSQSVLSINEAVSINIPSSESNRMSPILEASEGSNGVFANGNTDSQFQNIKIRDDSPNLTPNTKISHNSTIMNSTSPLYTPSTSAVSTDTKFNHLQFSLL